VLSATLVEARKITDKRHGYRGRVSLIDLGNGSEKARINSRLISGGWPFPDGFGRPKARFRSPSFLKTPGEQDPAKTTSALEKLTDSSRTLRQVRKVPEVDIIKSGNRPRNDAPTTPICFEAGVATPIGTVSGTDDHIVRK